MHIRPVDDIDAVIGRFQAWAGSRNATENKPGIRDLSYDEALQSHPPAGGAANPRPPKTKILALPSGHLTNYRSKPG